MTEQYGTDTSDDTGTDTSTEGSDAVKVPPIKVEITNQPKEKEIIDNTAEDTEDEYQFELTDEQIKEMTDAQ